ncbi:autophagy-related protein 17 [Phanerochaete sordida]|uniref:Autophagy-related protein 17 n=1 Tax=Phanerochaete sordida TaxID=48140 RepID=A0A9P3GKU5_9APHY|nr:autophagy-related protein 17 [Phanerochaete sordida]
MANAGYEEPHLVSLVLQSKKALQQGEQLCANARTVSMQSAQAAVDVLALDAKVRWMTDAVLEQLQLAAGVAKIIEQKRMALDARAKEWDDVRKQRTDALDTILDALGAQLVPPEFHTTSPVSSLFGSPNASEDEAEETRAYFKPGQSPTETLRDVLRNGIGSLKRKHRELDRTRWKTLRDFVDERSIEDLLDNIESERGVLDDILAKTSDYSESLNSTISAIRSSLPSEIVIPPMDDIFSSQETISTDMANHLSSLTRHYDSMAQALHDNEAGEIFSEADIQDMHRDTEELPKVISDLEKSGIAITASYEQLLSAKHVAEEQLGSHRAVLDNLDELGNIMDEMLAYKQAAEDEFADQLASLHTDLGMIEDLHTRYTQYQYSYCKLVEELARRREYAVAAAKIVKSMTLQLEALTEEERQRREQFNEIHGDHLPSDVCPAMQNPPTRYEILPWNNEPEESLPNIPADLLQEALDRIRTSDEGVSASQSL